MLKADYSGFIPVKTQQQANHILEDFVYLDTGVDEVMIARRDMALAVALLPLQCRAKFISKEGFTLVTTLGNFLDRMYFPSKEETLNFHKDVVRYQQSNDSTLSVFCVIEDSEFDYFR